MEDRIAAYLQHRMPHAAGVTVDELGRIHGGSSQETFRLRARWSENDMAIERRLILRREPPSGLVVAERDLEYTVYAALAGHDVPVPAVHFLELDGRWLDRPFFVMDMMPGKPGHFYFADPYEGKDREVAIAFWRHLGTLASLDHRALGLEGLRNGGAGDRFWARELDHWEAILDANEHVIEPVTRAALRWLRRNPPPEPAKPAIVHGDYRSGNFLFLPEDGRISAILDWEMAHIGDPLEDVAWAIDASWPMTRHMPLDEGLAIWSKASGTAVDRDALDWFRIFAGVKACGIWTTAEASFTGGRSQEMVVAVSGFRSNPGHRRIILDLIGPKLGIAL